MRFSLFMKPKTTDLKVECTWNSSETRDADTFGLVGKLPTRRQVISFDKYVKIHSAWSELHPKYDWIHDHIVDYLYHFTIDTIPDEQITQEITPLIWNRLKLFQQD